jgi:hypothetical protein
MLLASVIPPDPKTQAEQMMFLNAAGGLGFFIFCTIIKPQMTEAKVIAFCIAVCDAMILFARYGKAVPFVFLLVPIAFIWFGDEFGGFKGNVGRGTVNTETPGWMVAGFGWLLLLAVSGYVIYHFWRLPPQHR